MSAERVLHVAAVVLLVCSFPLCFLAWYIDVSVVLPATLGVLGIVGHALLLCADKLRWERERRARLDECREREAEFRTKWFKPEESQ